MYVCVKRRRPLPRLSVHAPLAAPCFRLTWAVPHPVYGMCLCIPLSRQRRHVVLCLKRPGYGTWRLCPARQNTHLEFSTHACIHAGLLKTTNMCMNHSRNGKQHGLTNALLIVLTGAVIRTGLKVTCVRVWVFLAKPWARFWTGFVVYSLLYWSLSNLGLGPSLGDWLWGGCVTFEALVWSLLLLYNRLGNECGIYTSLSNHSMSTFTPELHYLPPS